MDNIQKKSLQHVSDILKSIDSFNIYRAVSNALDEAKIPSDVKSRIIDSYQPALNEEMSKVKSAKEWVDTIVSDIK